MDKNNHFKPTALHKEFKILELIEFDSKLTQRDLSKILNVSVSTINEYIDTYEKNGYLKKVYNSPKFVDYVITAKGIERKRFLNMGYLKFVQEMYDEAKKDVKTFLDKLIEKNIANICLYGAGEVSYILTTAIKDLSTLNLVGIFDDDLQKQGKNLLGIEIRPMDEINNIDHDAVIIASFGQRMQMADNLIKFGYNENKIVHFFNEEGK